MAILTFPASPLNGEYYPVAPLPGQNQYQWEQATLTWRLIGAGSGVAAGIYGNADNIPQITVDATGRITLATDIPIGSYYVKTNNNAAYNNYVWPNFDGAANEFLSTDGSGNLSWVANPFINYWILNGSTIEPASNSYDLAIRDPSNDVTFFVDNATGVMELTAPGGAGSAFLQLEPSNAGSTITAAVSATGASPLAVRGSTFSIAAYGNSFLNTPSEVTLTQSLLDSSVSISTDGSITVNAGTVNSFSTPGTRGTAGQFLVSNGNGTTAWTSIVNNDFWVRTGTILSPLNPGDTVEVDTSGGVPAVLLNPTGIIQGIRGLQSFSLNPNFAADTTQFIAYTNTNDPGKINITGNQIVLQPTGGIFANPATTFTVSNPGNINLSAVIGGVNTNLFTVDDSGNMQVGRYIDNLAPALDVEGVSGNVTVAGRLTVNAGVPLPSSTNSYTFPGNRGVLDYALFTNADGTTRWDNVSSVAGYWSENGLGTELYPTNPGRSVLVTDNTSATTITLNSTGWIQAVGGGPNNPTYSFFGNKTGFYGGTTDQINIGVDGKLVAKYDDNFYYVYEDINFVGKSTNPGADAIFENTNTELLFTASSSTAVPKDIVFENFLNNQVAKFSNTGDFTVNYGNMAVGSTTVATSISHITLSIGANAAGKAGKLKLYSTYNGGDGFELTQSDSNGDVSFAVNSGAGSTLVIAATTPAVAVNGDFNATGNTTLGGKFNINNTNTPASATAAGTQGDIAWDNNYFYVCIAANTWKRTPLSTW